MKLSLNPKQFKKLILCAGILGMILRILLYTTGIDGRGLLKPAHWANIGVWLLTALTLAVLLLQCRTVTGPQQYNDCHPASFSAAVGAFAAMVGIGWITIGDFGEFSNRLNLIVWVLGLCSAVAFGCIGLCRLTGRKPLFLLHTAICIYFALRMVSQYQLWSSDPQLQDYCFYLTAHVALMLTAYHHGAFDVSMGNHRALWFFSLASVYLCLLSHMNTADSWLLLGCGIWAFTNLTQLRVRRRRPRPVLNLDADIPAEE